MEDRLRHASGPVHFIEFVTLIPCLFLFQSDEAVMPPPAVIANAEKTDAVIDTDKTGADVEKPAVVAATDKPEAVTDTDKPGADKDKPAVVSKIDKPEAIANVDKEAVVSNADNTDAHADNTAALTKTVEPKEPVKEMPTKETSVKETSTFIASAAAAVEVKGGTPLLSRRAVKLTGADKNVEKDKNTDTEKEKEGKKKIRRNSKGFERFEDYFSDSEDGESTVEKTNDVTVDKESDDATVKTIGPVKKSIGEKNKKSPVKEVREKWTKLIDTVTI